jgi:hypothetical protein
MVKSSMLITLHLFFPAIKVNEKRDIISELAKKTDTVYVPGEDGVYSILKVPSWLSIVLTGTSLPWESVNAMAISPVEKRNNFVLK